MSNTMTRRLEKDDVALQIDDHKDGEDIRILRRLPGTGEWTRESTLSKKEARDVHALLGDSLPHRVMKHYPSFIRDLQSLPPPVVPVSLFATLRAP